MHVWRGSLQITLTINNNVHQHKENEVSRHNATEEKPYQYQKLPIVTNFGCMQCQCMHVTIL